MTNPPYDGEEQDGGTAAPQADPNTNLTRPVQPFDRPAPPSVQPHGQPAPGGAHGYSPPSQQYAQPTQPVYGQPPAQYGQSQYGQSQYGQPQYGQSQYGPPPQYGRPAYGPEYGRPGQPYAPYRAGPPGKSRVGLIAAGTGIALLLVLGVVVLVMTLRSTVLDPAAVERDVAAQFEQREGVAIDLSCADGMHVDEGDSYRCTGMTADGEEVTLQITVTDEESAAYTWTEP